MSRLLVVDGSYTFLRSFHALSHENLKNDGKPTWGIFGTINAISTIVKGRHPTHMVIVFDWGGSDFRKSIWPEYKANRTHSDDGGDVIGQMQGAQEILSSLGLVVWRERGIEGDDIIARVAEKLAPDVDEIQIISGDKDMRQLITQKTIVVHPSVGYKPVQIWKHEDVVKEYGVPPERLPEIMALEGDRADNVPGVPGIGRKTAVKLIAQYGSLSGVALSGEKKIVGHQDKISMSHALVEARPDLSSFDMSIEDVVFRPVEKNNPQSLLLEEDLKGYGFDQILAKWRNGMLWGNGPFKRLSDIRPNL